ncbi:MAG: YbhB/YbcL family Raf kinase inhibitor-like protein [Candidatus Marinimicrobia bacterium]|nr:YbhB/YbcL family Raf kinase inhibitor-like protein [Candidatus Neomarinimicrobiota bacterium]MCF7904508.1 YbhB/YbcL family Raf kinase inhibitor-like protein [Candidatus Neomarinimicrobiota bacterium]
MKHSSFNSRHVSGLLLSLFILLWSCQTGGDGDIQVASPAFEKGGMIPERYTCDSTDISPPLSWSNTPEGTKSFALICDDPDAPMGTWVHWVLFNIPAEVTEIPRNLPPMPELANGARHGTNDFGKLGYGGPCPPGGKHRYYFKIYALSKMLDLEAGASKADLLAAMEGHVLSEGQLMGKYRRK